MSADEDSTTTTPPPSIDLCDSLNAEDEYFCHVCMSDGRVHYAKINAELGRGTVYGTEVPTCARIPRNAQHLAAFAMQCFPAGMGYVRNEFFPGHDTMACDEIPVNNDNTATRRNKKTGTMLGGVLFLVLIIVVVAMLCNYGFGGGAKIKTKTTTFAREPTIMHIPLNALRHA